MTNEEALSILHCPDTAGGLYSEKYGEALSMAMEAIKKDIHVKVIQPKMAEPQESEE